MAHSDVLTHVAPSLSGTAAKDLIGANGSAAKGAAKARTASLRRIAFAIAFVMLSCAAVVLPLSLSGGYFARGRGDIAALDAATQTLTYQEDGRLASLQVSDSTRVYRNGRPVTFEELRLGDLALVRYESVLRLNAQEIRAVGRRP